MGRMMPRMGGMTRKQTRTPRLVAAARRNIMRAHVNRIGRRGMRYNTRYPKPVRDLIRMKAR